MKKIILLFSIILLPLFILSQSVQKGPYTVSVIDKNIYHIEDANDSNPAGVHLDEKNQYSGMNNCSDMYLVVGTKTALLIDLSNKINWDNTATESLRTIVYERAGDAKLYITVTHRHGDHLGMLPAFNEDEKAGFWIPKAEFEGMDIFPKDRTVYFGENSSLDLGGFVVNTMEVPGHTAHSTLFFLNNKNIVFTGDAIGSGSGVWLFNEESFYTYKNAVNNLVKYIENPENKIDVNKLQIYGGHYWQCKQVGQLTSKYIYDMQALIIKIGEGTAGSEPNTAAFSFLDTNFKYGTATITWNKEAAKNYAESEKGK
ncbi:MAG: MBL fold metallo-hydrolase [Bacteroidales bacterium]|nr:MBL fold metallo-hydrolase [Bacteroidales bacterium]